MVGKVYSYKKWILQSAVCATSCMVHRVYRGSVQANFMLMHSQKLSNGVGNKVVLVTQRAQL